jgi:DNA-directed RNA polymerase specialized sigma24 family protein
MTPESFERFLAFLHADRDQAAEQYELLRRKLIRLFEWNRCPFPEEHTDEVFDRMFRKLVAGDEIRDPSTYCLGIGRMVCLEVLKTQEKKRMALEEIGQSSTEASRGDDTEQQLECLNRCLNALPGESRVLILGYYQMEKSAKIRIRKVLAERLAIPINALRIRASAGSVLAAVESRTSCVTTKAATSPGHYTHLVTKLSSVPRPLRV